MTPFGPLPVDRLRTPVRPDRPALVDAETGETLSYARLNAQVDALAHAFAIAGLLPGGIVAIEACKSCSVVVAMLAAMRAGATAAPCDPELPDARVDAMLARTNSSILFGSKTWTAARHNGGQQQAQAFVAPGLPTLAPAPPHSLRPVDPKATALLLHTSGSTGRPKAVPLSHLNIAAFLDGAKEMVGYDVETRFLNVCPLFFDASILDLFGTWDAGGTVYLLQKPVMAGLITEALERHRITDTLLVSSVLRMLVGRFSDIRSRDLSALRSIWFGAESCPLEVLREIDRFIPGLTFIHGYGPTETTHSASLHVVKKLPEDGAFLPIGRPLRHIETRIETASGRAAAADQTGELLIAGPQVTAGYLNDPERNATAFVERDGRRFYRTGDLVRSDTQGVLWFVGRRDDGIKVNGNLVHLSEVEAVAMMLEGVRDAVAVALPDARSGYAIHLILSAIGAQPPSVTLIEDGLRMHLPAYMCPRRILWRDSETLPRNQNGKIDRAVLREGLLRDLTKVAT